LFGCWQANCSDIIGFNIGCPCHSNESYVVGKLWAGIFFMRNCGFYWNVLNRICTIVVFIAIGIG
jgi:hypothetical protein